MVNFARFRVILTVVAVVIAYSMLVPIVPFQRYYQGDFTTESKIQSVGCRGGVYWLQTIPPPEGTNQPTTLSTFEVVGAESLSALVSGIGAVSIGLCAYTPFTTDGFPWILLISALVSVAVALSLFLVVSRPRSLGIICAEKN